MKRSIRYFLLASLTILTFQLKAQQSKRRLILRDEGLSQLSYVDLAKPEKNWFVPIPAGRDLQLVGQGRVLLGTGDGYEERDISTGKKLKEVTQYKGTVAARRLRNGRTLLTGLNMVDKKGIVLIEIDNESHIKKLINYPELSYVRLVRETPSGNYLVTSDTVLFECDTIGRIVWRTKISSKKSLHIWQALRLANGQTILSTGFGANFQFFAKDGKPLSQFTGPAEAHPHFFAGFQILKNGNLVVTNWQGHGPGHGESGLQILEFAPDGKLAWSWKQDATKFSSLQGVIVLDGLNPKYLHVEDLDGKLAPVKR